MPTVLVRDLPPDVHATLQMRAQAHGLSLQQYLSAELRRLAERPTIDEVLDQLWRRSGGRIGLAEAAQVMADERARR